jgi:hypothetical protein
VIISQNTINSIFIAVQTQCKFCELEIVFYNITWTDFKLLRINATTAIVLVKMYFPVEILKLIFLSHTRTLYIIWKAVSLKDVLQIRSIKQHEIQVKHLN